MSQKILVPVDGTELAEQVIYRVEKDILLEPGDAEIVITHVQVPSVGQGERAKMTGKLVQQTLVANTRGVVCKLEQVVADTVPEGILEVAKRENVDLIAMYTDSARPVEERPQGSYSRAVAENTLCEVRVLEARLKPVHPGTE